MEKLLSILDSLNIEYQIQHHQVITTIEEAKHVNYTIPGIGAKSLFVKDKKHHLYFILVMHEDKMADLKMLKQELNCSSLSFANVDELHDILKLESGGITPCGVINDSQNMVKNVVIDKSLKDNYVLVHPNILTATLSIKYEDLLKLIKFSNHSYLELEM